MHSEELLRARSRPPVARRDILVRCIADCFDCAEACLACADACLACADACLAEARPDEFRACIVMAQDCADICISVGRILSRQTDAPFALRGRCIDLAAEASRQCADECARQAPNHAYCRVCVERCRACEQSCRDLLASDYTMPCSAPDPLPLRGVP